MDDRLLDLDDPYALARPTVARAIVERHGHRLGKSLGQYLLTDRRVLERIVASSGVGPTDVVLEVGPGIGTLTRAIAARAAHVVAVEADRRLEPVLDETLAGLTNVRLVFMDALGLTPEVIEEPMPTRFIANLPYNVAATLVLDILDRFTTIEDATVMVQREVGERMAARPCTKEYGAYTVKLGLRATARAAFRVGPAAFFPPPRVDSVVVVLQRVAGSPAAPMAVVDTVVDAAFSQRRKMLRSALSAGLGVAKDDVVEALAAAGIEPTERAEALAVADFIRLARECYRRSLVNLRSYLPRHTIAKRCE